MRLLSGVGMNILDWIDVGEVSAERDDLLPNYYFDNGVLSGVVSKPSSFLVLGRKGAGKTAVFRYLSNNPEKFIGPGNLLIPLSFEDYNWNIHSLLKRPEAAESLTYKQSWRFVILVEVMKAYAKALESRKERLPEPIKKARNLLAKIFDEPIPSIYTIVSRKLLSLSKFSLPTLGLEDLDSFELGGGEVSFESVRDDKGMQDTLSQNIENIISIIERAIEDSLPLEIKIYLVFDRVDEAWDDISFDKSRRVIAGLIGACDSITSSYKDCIRPIVFLREDIFETLSINDANKLREDCGALLHWQRDSLFNMILLRVNYFAEQNCVKFMADDLDSIFDKKEMRQRARPSNYILKRSMMRPRDIICFIRRVIKSMKDESQDPFADSLPTFPLLSADSIYAAEPGYSEWLKNELIDEWRVQKPEIITLFTAIENRGSTNFGVDDITKEMRKLGIDLTKAQAIQHLRFLFDNSVLGFKSGQQNYWRYKCFYPTQGFVEVSEYRIHDGLVRALNLKEPRERDVDEGEVASVIAG